MEDENFDYDNQSDISFNADESFLNQNIHEEKYIKFKF